ncbi:serine carboxypeptidase-like 13 isoform X2 [Solanum pennellii]|uniref:Serine carboxypeptidase-like 13 isoform X2 n=1 Tax=Solanum pennellii TaxID=28526 RepID=A0ABM1VBL0_SOLPN|nr:serine carboxypeptidase-like 13 isoform X2 [Solanum pennellii]
MKFSTTCLVIYIIYTKEILFLVQSNPPYVFERVRLKLKKKKKGDTIQYFPFSTREKKMKYSKMKCSLYVVLIIFVYPLFVLAGSPVKYLPGFEGPLPFQLETGYIGVGEANEVQLFYYFIKSQSNSKIDPLIYWFTGGPGCSPLSAILYELGPITVDIRAYNGSLPTLSLNPYAYTKWLIEHQEYLNNPFYVGGDSYSGITVPIVTQVISNGNDMGIKPWINLKGYILGNPVTSTDPDYKYKVPFAHGMGLIPNELYESFVTNCGRDYSPNDSTNQLCSRDIRTFDWLINDIYQYHILESPCELVSHDSRRSLAGNVQKLKNLSSFFGMKCREEWHELSVIWANDKVVQDALHVRKTSMAWERCRSNLSFGTIINNSVSYHANLSRKGFRSLIYSGDHDMVVPFSSTQLWIKSLNYSIINDWKPWVVDGQVAGYTRSYSNQMTFATVKGGGHTAPEWKRVECLEMLKRWLSHVSL